MGTDLGVVLGGELHVIVSMQLSGLIEVHDVLTNVVLGDLSARQSQTEGFPPFRLLNFLLHFVVNGARCEVGQSGQLLQDLFLSV